MDITTALPDFPSVLNQAGELAMTFWNLVSPYVGLFLVISAFLATTYSVMRGIPWIVFQIKWRLSVDYKMNVLRSDARSQIRANKQNEQDFLLWKQLHKND